jgi:hypothetical protein
VAIDNGPYASQVFVYREDGSLGASITPYGTGYRGGVRFARADFTGDGVPDLITVPEAGIEAQVRVWDGATGGLLAAFDPFPGYTGGLWVAVGDVNGDGVTDVAFGTDSGTLPAVTVYSGRDARVMASFLAYPSGTPGGARLAIGDVNHDGYADIVTAYGAGAPIISVFDGRAIALGQGGQRLVGDFYLYSPQFQLGVNIAVGDVDGDGYADIIGGPNMGPAYMRVISGKSLTTGEGKLDLANTFLWQGTNTGIRFAAVDADGDGRTDIMATPGGAASGYVGLLASSTLQLNTPSPYWLNPLPGLTTGVFVG